MASNSLKFDDIFHHFGDDEDIIEDESLDFDVVALEMERKVEMKPDRMEITVAEIEPQVIESSEDSLPSYLSKQIGLFDRMMSVHSTQLEELREMAHIIHQLNTTKSFISLWQIYIDSGMGRLKISQTSNEFPQIWPNDMKKMMIRKGVTLTTNEKDLDHVSCLNFAQDYLRQLNDELEQYQMELKDQQRRHSWYNKEINDKIERFVYQQHLQGVESKIQQKILLVKLDYRIQLNQMEFLQLNPNANHTTVFQQLIQAKQDLLNSKLKVDLLKQQVFYQKLPDFLQHLQLPIVPIIDQVHHPANQRSLQNQYERVIQQTTSDLMLIYVAAAETKMRESQSQMDEMMQNMDQQLLPSMIDLLFRRFKLMDERLKEYYQYKIYFFVQAPTVKAES